MVISRSTVGKTLRRYRLTRNVQNVTETRRHKLATNEMIAQDVPLA